MQKKSTLRNYIVHYDYRWSLLKHNLKNSEHKKISLYDKMILSQINSGSTLSLDIGGLQYTGLVPDLTVTDPLLEIGKLPDKKLYDNILMVNGLELKYKTLDQIESLIVEQTDRLNHQAKVIVGFNYQFVNINRLTQDYKTALTHWIDSLEAKNFQLQLQLVKKIPSTNPYGDSFFIFSTNN